MKEVSLSAPEMIDRNLAAAFRRRALARAKGGEDFLLAHAASDMAERLMAVDRKFERAALISPSRPERRKLLPAGDKIGALETGFHAERAGRDAAA